MSKPSQALTRARDWARKMSELDRLPTGIALNPEYFQGPGQFMRQTWVRPPITEHERALWRQIADEIDAFIERGQPDDVDGQLELTPPTKHAEEKL